MGACLPTPVAIASCNSARQGSERVEAYFNKWRVKCLRRQMSIANESLARLERRNAVLHQTNVEHEETIHRAFEQLYSDQRRLPDGDAVRSVCTVCMETIEDESALCSHRKHRICKPCLIRVCGSQLHKNLRHVQCPAICGCDAVIPPAALLMVPTGASLVREWHHKDTIALLSTKVDLPMHIQYIMADGTYNAFAWCVFLFSNSVSASDFLFNVFCWQSKMSLRTVGTHALFGPARASRTSRG